jgi:hypothetical protein
LPTSYTNLPPDMIGESTPRSGRFRVLPQSWRDSISRRLGASPTVIVVAPGRVSEIQTPATGAVEPPITAPVLPVSSPQPAAQAPVPGLPDFTGSTANLLSPVQIIPRAPDTWSAPPEPPITTQPPLPLRDPGMGWTKEAESSPSPLPPPPAPSYPSRFHILPEGCRKTLGKCLNNCGMACYADRDTPGCGSCRQEFLFVFGSCHYFFGEKCFPDY